MVPVPTALSPGEDRQLRHVGRDPSRLIFADPPQSSNFVLRVTSGINP